MAEPAYNFAGSAAPAAEKPSWIKNMFGVGTSPVTGQRRLPAFGRARAVHQAQQEIALEVEQMRMEQMRWGMLEKATSMRQRVHQQEGMAELNYALSEGDFSDPKTLNAALAIAAKYGLPSEVLDPVMKRFNEAELYKNKMGLIEKEYGLRGELSAQESEQRMRLADQGVKVSAVMQQGQEYEKLYAEFITMPEGPMKEARRRRLTFMENQASGGMESETALQNRLKQMEAEGEQQRRLEKARWVRSRMELGNITVEQAGKEFDSIWGASGGGSVGSMAAPDYHYDADTGELIIPD
jgi:hypothetical protein